VKGHFVKRGNTWAVYYERPRGVDGKRRKASKTGFATKKEAQQWFARTIVALTEGSFVEPSKVTLGQFLRDGWLPSLKTRGLRPNTLRGYEQNMDKHVLRSEVASVPLQRLSPGDLTRLYSRLSETGKEGQPLSARSVRYVHMILRQALRDAAREGRVVRNVADLATPPKAAAAARDAERARQAWSAEELRQFLEHVRPDRLSAAFLLAATTGMRRGEVLGLRWRDVDFERSRLSVTQTVTSVGGELVVSTPKTQKGTRSVALDPTTLEALRAHKRRQAEEQLAFGPGYEESGLAFRNADGSPISPNAFSNAFKHRVRAAKVPTIRLHDLRHTHATLALQAGVHAKVVSERLGHSTIAITLDTYSHAIPAMEEDAAERVAALVFGPVVATGGAPANRS
jgi:integrase